MLETPCIFKYPERTRLLSSESKGENLEVSSALQGDGQSAGKATYVLNNGLDVVSVLLCCIV